MLIAAIVFAALALAAGLVSFRADPDRLPEERLSPTQRWLRLGFLLNVASLVVLLLATYTWKK